jgi:hypothetical protein
MSTDPTPTSRAAEVQHPDLQRLRDVQQAARERGYTEGDVNHRVQPIIGLLRLRQHHGEPVTDEDVERAIEALTDACLAERAWLLREQESAQGALTEVEEFADEEGCLCSSHLIGLGLSATNADRVIRTHERILAARGGTAAAGDEGLREPVLAWIDGVREWAEALKAAPEAATASSRGIGRDLTGHLSALRDITEGWDELGTAEMVSSLRTAALDAALDATLDATLAPAAAAGDEGLRAAADDIKARIVTFRDLHADDQYLNALNDAWGLVANRLRRLDATPAPTEDRAPCGCLHPKVAGCDHDDTPTEDPAPSQDTLRAAVVRVLRPRLQEALDIGEAGTHVDLTAPGMASVVADEVLAALAATTPEATGRDGVEG